MTGLPVLAEILDTVRVVALPMQARFRGVDMREAVLFEGPEGWAEFSPFVEYPDAEAATWLAAGIADAWRPRPAALREQIMVNATVPAVPVDQVAALLARFDGCRTVKVKVAEAGQSLADDVARVRAVRAELGPEGRIRIDANASWNIDEAERAIHALAGFDLEYAEQPCASIDELIELRGRIGYLDIPIAVDESVRKASDPLAVARSGAADLLVIKAQPLGGIDRALAIVAEAGLPVVVSSALDTAIGLSLGAALAAALPSLEHDCGLGTAALFADDVADARPRGGMVSAERVTPEPTALERLAAPAERRDWWVERLSRCHALLAADPER